MVAMHIRAVGDSKVLLEKLRAANAVAGGNANVGNSNAGSTSGSDDASDNEGRKRKKKQKPKDQLRKKSNKSQETGTLPTQCSPIAYTDVHSRAFYRDIPRRIFVD